MGNLGGTFEKRIKQLGLKKQVDASLVVEKAQRKIEKIFGERGNQNLKAISYKNGILKVAASSNAWAAECQHHNQKLIIEQVKTIKFIIKREIIQ